MANTQNSFPKRLALVASFLLAFLVVLNLTTFLFYKRARSHLDDELGERLRAVASGLAHTVEIAAGDTLTVGGIDPSVFSALFAAQSENALSNVVVLAPGGVTVLDLEGYAGPGELNPFIDLDYSAVALARSGIPSYTTLYRSGDLYMKSAYAPVLSNDAAVIAIIGVEAGAEFFATLRELTSLIVLFSIVSAAVVFVLGGLFLRQSRSLDRTQEAMLRQDNLVTMGRMVANIAHEIRNPLSIIKTSAERLRRKYELQDDAVDYITDEVDVLNGILTGYLDFARSGPGDFAPQSVRSIVDRSLMAVQNEVEKKRIKVSSNFTENNISVMGDERRLRQAVLNVLLNAAQAVSEEGTISILLTRSGDRGIIMVSDNGPGIASGDVSEVIKPFYTTKAGGSGLGLNVVNSIVEQHGGDMRIENAPGGGTRVRLAFPLAAASKAKDD